MLISPCPICHGTNRYYSFQVGEERFDECWDCGLLQHKSRGGKSADSLAYPEAQPEAAAPFAQYFFDLLHSYSGLRKGSIGILGQVSPALVQEAGRRGFSAEVLKDTPAGVTVDVLIVANQLERAQEPLDTLGSWRDLLNPDGVIALISKQLIRTGAPRTAKTILNPEQRYSFSDLNFQTLLLKTGFKDTFLGHTHMSRAHRRAAQEWLEDQSVVFARRTGLAPSPMLSIILPVYNEAKTVSLVLDSLLQKEFPGVRVEVLIVESASTDGSREAVLRYKDRPGVRVILQDRPQGKGFAVREGIRAASGDIILIQDADMEYDLLDYEMLLSPILSGRTAFVLGTRHAGHWKIRQFSQYFLADLMNMGHWFLLWLMNRLYRQSMTDPFTMFKVFRRDCLFGIEMECNRFDFDVELVCKLLRKGYTPLEIPVNYQARSFSEGKKVNVLTDPFTWIKAILKYRFSRVFRLPYAERRVS